MPGRTVTFHYVTAPGSGEGVERASGRAIGIELDQILESGLPPFNIALGLIAGLCEILAILEEDGETHGQVSCKHVLLDDEGIISLEGFGGAERKPDRRALGEVALEILGGTPPPVGAGENDVVDAVLALDLSGLDGTMVGDVQWYLASLLSRDPSPRCAPVEVWWAMRAYAATLPGPTLAEWGDQAVDGGGQRRARPTRTDAIPTRYGTAFVDRASMLMALGDKSGMFRPTPGGGTKTKHWTLDQLDSMSRSGEGPRPRRGTGVTSQRQRDRGHPVTRFETAPPPPPRVAGQTLAAVDHEGAGMTIGGGGLSANGTASISRELQFTTRHETFSTTPDQERRLFRVDVCLGRGGFGEVYLCTMTSPGGIRAQVAVKVLREGVDPRAQAVQRLRDEARVLASLEHPAILTAHDLVVLGDRVAMVTEYVPGADLDVCMDHADPPPLRAVLEALAITAEALDASWNAVDETGRPIRLVHRDIKPSNIRLGTHGQVKVLDFGIAKFASEREAMTQNNQVMGTLAYMPPERLSSAASHPAGDVYALGAILYEALAHQELWADVQPRNQYFWSMDQRAHDRFIIDRLAHLEESELLSITRQCLAYNPDERPTTGSLARSLEELAEARREPSLRRWARDHQWSPPAQLEAELVGRVISEGRSDSTLNRPPAPSVPPTPVPDTAFEPSLPPPPPEPPFDEGPVFDADGFDDWDEDAPPVGRVSRSLMLATATIGLLVFGSALLAGGGVAFFAGAMVPAPAPATAVQPQLGEATAPEEQVADTDAPAPSREPLASTVETTRPRQAPDAEASAPAATSKPTAVSGIATSAPAPGPKAAATSKPPTLEGCGPLSTLELSASTGSLPGATQDCLSDAMRATSMKMTDRQKVGRIALVNSKSLCSTGQQCERYETLQNYYFEELDRSDPEMMSAYARHLLDSGRTSVERNQQARLWATRALERGDTWSGRVRAKRLQQLHEIRAIASTRVYELEPSERHREVARDDAVEWAEVLRSLNLPASRAMELCVSAAGSTDVCDKRVSTDAVEEEITLLSIPARATVTVDGSEVGLSPVSVKLVHGSHEVEMHSGNETSKRTIQVGAGEPVRWQWRSGEEQWKSWH